MRVHAGSIILEPGLVEGDFAELRAQGVWLAKAGFGAFPTPYDYEPMVAWAKAHGMVTTVHTGGSSIPGSSGIWADHLIAMEPRRVVPRQWRAGRHARRRLPAAGRTRAHVALQVCTAGNLRTALLVADLLGRRPSSSTAC